MSPRFGSEEEVGVNLDRFFSQLGIERAKSVKANLVHGDEIIEVTKEHVKNRTSEVECDALITKETDIYIWLVTADCLPIYYFDPVKQVVALAHCGWQSTDKYLAEKVALKMIKEYGCQPENILVAMGPAIHKKSYIFDAPTSKTLPNWSKYLEDLPNGETMVDNIQYNIDQLVGVGIKMKNIETSTIDTGATTEYFSHYRSKRSEEIDGRFCNVIGLKHV